MGATRIARLAAVAVVAAGMVLPGAGAAAVRPGASGDECRMFETKPGYECRSGEWRVDPSPPRKGKACSFGERAPGRDLKCVAGRWRANPTPKEGDRCTAVGAKRVGVGGMLTCRHGVRGLAWE
ncbi:hypothetical protein [Tsukamurella sp. 1534]|uniref:hypothetical protein n=1 Tax=Tsukamurella sp. 1534 TaxID=1151061 RepID=UPI00031D68BB|nr:hypothetical protein [Tsukamurella sp. 1534]